MRVSTQVEVDNKELVNAVIAAAKEAAGIKDAGSATVKFFIGEEPKEIVGCGTLAAVVEFVKAGH